MKFAKEAASNQEYNEFIEQFISNVQEDVRIDTNALSQIIERDVGSPFSIYYEDRSNPCLVMNVKYMGAGNWDKFNKDDRSTKIGLDDEYYYDKIRQYREDVYEDWSERWFNAFGANMCVCGRSGGYWGVTVKSLMKNENFSKLFQMDEKAVKRLWREARKAVGDDTYEQAEWASGELYYPEDAIKYFRISPEFKSWLQNFQKALQKLSDEWETQDWNDSEFQSDKEAWGD